MKRLIVPAMVIVLTSSLAPAQAQGWGDFLKNILGGKSETTDTKESTETTTSPTTTSGNVLSSVLSESDAQAGLKEALVVGAKAVATQLSAENGYFGDANIQIPLPGRLGDVQKQLGKIGMAGPLDDLQLRMNRAAEESAPKAVDLVINAVQNLTIEDAVALVNGGDTAATDLLRLKTYDKLEGLLQPYVESALEDAGALQMLDNVVGRYNLSQYNLNPREDLVDHSVEKALDGLFFYLAKEEQDIRKNPVDRTSDLLRRVFGG